MAVTINVLSTFDLNLMQKILIFKMWIRPLEKKSIIENFGHFVLQVFNAITHMVLKQKKDKLAKANEQSGVIKVKKDKQKRRGKFCWYYK